MITVKLEGAKELTAALVRMREKAVPYAFKNALNTAAFETRTIWQREIKREFVIRNAWTERSVRVEQASVTKLTSVVGSVADYMGKQEEGGTVKGKSGHIKAIPTAAAAGQSGAGTRTRLIRSKYYLSAIHASPTPSKGGRRQQNAIAIAIARAQGKSVVLLKRPNGGKGLFLMGKGTKRHLRTKLIWDVSRGSVHVHAKPTLELAIAAVKPKLEHMLEAALTQQMQRFSVGK